MHLPSEQKSDTANTRKENAKKKTAKTVETETETAEAVATSKYAANETDKTNATKSSTKIRSGTSLKSKERQDQPVMHRKKGSGECKGYALTTRI